MREPGHRRISGAPPAPGVAMRDAARKTGWRPGDEPERSSAPRPRRPFGLSLGRASSLSALLGVLPGTARRAFANPSRPSRQRAERPPGGLVLGKEAREGRCWRSSDERADTARRPDGPVPSGAGGGRRMALLASLDRRPACLRSAVAPCSPGATRAASPYSRIGPS